MTYKSFLAVEIGVEIRFESRSESRFAPKQIGVRLLVARLGMVLKFSMYLTVCFLSNVIKVEVVGWRCPQRKGAV
jgi:hypothetical protein